VIKTPTGKDLDPAYMQVSQMRKEQVDTTGFLACPGMLHNYPRGRS
jgi:hypothetical protein